MGRVARDPRSLLASLTVAGLLLTAIAVTGLRAGNATAAGATDAIGVYSGAANPSGIGDFASWSGVPVDYAEDFLATDTWQSISSPDWWLSGWNGSGYRLVLGVPMLPASGGTLAQGATGAYDDYFNKLARELVSYGFGNAIIRLGWEMNGGWYAWAAGRDTTSWIAYWRQIVTTMRQVAPDLVFDWNPTLGYGSVAADSVYPGDAYVDMIGVDAYDQAWGQNGSIVSDPTTRWNTYIEGGTYGLAWFANFAHQHGKPFSIPEWGEDIRSDGHGGGDDPYYMQQMASFIANPANNVVFASYFEFDAPDGKHALDDGSFPKSRQVFVQAFTPGKGLPVAVKQSPATTSTTTTISTAGTTPTTASTTTTTTLPTNTPPSLSKTSEKPIQRDDDGSRAARSSGRNAGRNASSLGALSKDLVSRGSGEGKPVLVAVSGLKGSSPAALAFGLRTRTEMKPGAA